MTEAEHMDGGAEDRLPEPLAGWLEAVMTVAETYQLDVSRERLRVTLSWGVMRDLRDTVRDGARQAGLRVRWVKPRFKGLSSWRLPVVVQFNDGQVAVVTAMGEDSVTLAFSGDEGVRTTVDMAELRGWIAAMAVMRPLQQAPDSRVDAFFKPVKKHWLARIVFEDKRPYVYIMLASLGANVLALATVIFSLQAYDRIIPAKSMPTLYVLFSAVVMALLFSFLLRNARMHIIDIIGKRADLRISDRVFGHALRVRNSARPQATGTFVQQLRELEPVRDMLTSTTVAVIADLPFFIMFCVVFWLLAGPLVWVPVAAFFALVIPSILAQPKLRRLARECMRESSLRSSLMVEAVQGMEDIKLLQAENSFQNQWNHYNAEDADSNLRLRILLHRLNNWTRVVQTGTYAVVVFVGAPMVMAGEMSIGVLVAASILSGRMLQPLSGLTQVLNRWQQAKVAAEALDDIMQMPIDYPEDSTRVHRMALSGEYEMRQAMFSYDSETTALRVDSLKIETGERIAVLGRNGSGKSTLLQALSGLMEPQSGSVLLDDVALGHIDPADVRRDVALLAQDSRLFFGSLRENLRLGAPHASDEELVKALQAAGAWEFVQKLPQGLDYTVMENGVGLSGGQRQGLLMARLLLRDPRVLLLDEPTARLDEVAERRVLERLRNLTHGRTVIVATHRPALLEIVDRVIVLDGCTVVLDGARDKVLDTLRKRARQSDEQDNGNRSADAAEAANADNVARSQSS